MKTMLLSLLAMLTATCSFAQNTFRAQLLNSENKETLIGATAIVEGTALGASSNENGVLTINNIPNGQQVIRFAYIGYQERRDTFSFPLTGQDTILIYMVEVGEEMDEVQITATRSSRTIADEPTRVEAITGEELDEKSNMNASNVSMLLRESTGIQVQQTSAVSGNSNIRIQGLDGRYTQLLKDGFPMYSGFSSGLSIMQIPPLDLKQVEVIKGSASTLYGGGAIAGLINFVSKTPQRERDLSFMVNGTSALGLDLNGYYGQRFNRVGVTVFGSRNSQAPYDVNGDGFTDIPQTERYTINPRLFFYFGDSTTLWIGANAATEKRIGGDMDVIRGTVDSLNVYSETNKSDRIASQLKFEKLFRNGGIFSVKNSVSYFDRSIVIPGYGFNGQQVASFSEISYGITRKKLEWVGGLNLWTDGFKETSVVSVGTPRNYSLTTVGGFIQNTWDAAERVTLETGLRTDYDTRYGVFVLPRVSALFRLSEKLTSRLGGGLGYKSPTIFTEEAEELVFRNVLPIDVNSTKAETSIGANLDFNYRFALFEQVSVSINQMFFYTRLDRALLLTADTLGLLRYENADGHIDTRGLETNIKVGYEDFKLFVGYTFINTKRHYNNLNNEIPLTPRHRLGLVLMYEVEEKWRVGYEAYYTSPQKLSSGISTRDYWTMGFMVERKWERFSVFVNFENFLDTRQSRFQPMYTGTEQAPQFTEVYAPTDGRIINGGFKLKI